MHPRPITRRDGPRGYLRERLPPAISTERIREGVPPEFVAEFVAGNERSSGLRRAMRAAGIDPRMGRLMLLLRGRRPVRVREVAWRLNVHPSTASRYLDRAEAAGLIDKDYADVIDRRATAAVITEKGRALRLQVEAFLASEGVRDPQFGHVYGRRSFPPMWVSWGE